MTIADYSRSSDGGGWTLGSDDTNIDALDRAASEYDDRVFIEIEQEVRTYGELYRNSNRLSRGLSSTGVRSGDRVVGVLDNCVQAVECWLAVNRLGAIWVPLNTALKGDFLLHQLNDSAPTVVIANDYYAHRLLELSPAPKSVKQLFYLGERPPGSDESSLAVRRFSELYSADGSRIASSVNPIDLSCLIYTGGTTGPSKACKLSHSYLMSQAVQQLHNQGRRAEEVIWSPLPLFHSNALVGGILPSLLIGGAASFSGRFSVSKFWPDVEKSGATIVSLLGSMMSLIAQAPENDASRRCHGQVRLVRGASWTASLRDTWFERFGVARAGTCAYGLTEAATITSVPHDEDDMPGSAGRRNAHFDVRIFDDCDREVPTGGTGEIVCRPLSSYRTFDGYWRMPEKTAEVFRNLWFHTGDYGRFDDEGWLYFVDRKKDYIRRKGENISSVEVEQVIGKHPDVSQVAVVGVASPLLDEEVKAVIVLRQGSHLTEEALTQWAVQRLPYFAVPRYVEIQDDLPRNEVGRIQKFVLRGAGVTDKSWDREDAGIDIEKR